MDQLLMLKRSHYRTSVLQVLLLLVVSNIATSSDVDVNVNALDVHQTAVNSIHTSSGENEALRMFSEETLSFNYSVTCATVNAQMVLSVEAPDAEIVEIVGTKTFDINCKLGKLREMGSSDAPSAITAGSTTPAPSQLYVVDAMIDLNVRTRNLGVTSLLFTVASTGNGTMAYDIGTNMTSQGSETVIIHGTYEYPVKVIRVMRPVDILFRVVVYCVQLFVGTGFGVKLDLQVVKQSLMKPVGPGIGFVCQYLLMPLTAFAITQAMDMGSNVVAFGLFIAGCCPGGGASNMYSYLLNGDLSLSITMTAISTVAALAMLPIWIYSLGSVYTGGNDVTIPFTTVIISLSILIIPLVCGVLLRLKFPKAADLIEKLLKPVTIIMILVLLVVGIYSNMFIFRMFKPRILIAGCLLPYIGYIVGGTISAIFRQKWMRIKTISIETGLQNTNIAYILLTSSFPPPYGDLAAVAPVASAVMTPLPLFIVTVTYLIYQKCKNRYQPVVNEEGDVTINELTEKA